MFIKKLCTQKTLFLISIVAIITSFFIYKKMRLSQSDGSTFFVGMMSGWPPYMSINKQGQFEGFDVDVAQAIADAMGKKLVIKDLGGLTSCFIALEQEKIDALFSGLDITIKRLKKIDMVQYVNQGITSFSLLFWDTIPQDIKTINDLKNRPNSIICIEPGSTPEKFLQDPQFAGIAQKQISAMTDRILDIKFGKSLATLVDSPLQVADLTRKTPEIKVLDVPLPKNYQILGTGIGIKKNNNKIFKKINTVVQQLRKNGTLQKLEQKWSITGVQS